MTDTRQCPDVDSAIESVYTYHHQSTEHNGRIATSLADVVWVSENTHSVTNNLDTVGRLASLLNLHFECGHTKVEFTLAKMYVEALTEFITQRSVIDEQQWTAAYRLIKNYRDNDVPYLALCNALREARTKPPFTTKAEFKLQVVELHKLVRM